MMRSMIALAATAGLLAACSGEKAGEVDKTQGPAVSTSEAPRNEAIDTTPTTGETAQTPGANSFTEAQARGAIESAGYTGVGGLTQDPQGLWMGKATKDGAEVNVSVDYKGAVSSK